VTQIVKIVPHEKHTASASNLERSVTRLRTEGEKGFQIPGGCRLSTRQNSLNSCRAQEHDETENLYLNYTANKLDVNITMP
jgi:hypothetical protein